MFHIIDYWNRCYQTFSFVTGGGAKLPNLSQKFMSKAGAYPYIGFGYAPALLLILEYTKQYQGKRSSLFYSTVSNEEKVYKIGTWTVLVLAELRT